MPTRAAPTLAIIATLVTAADLGAQFTPHAVWGTSSDDVWAVMAQSAPLRFGAGVKGKINMSMSAGLPVVATHVAAEGMHLRPHVKRLNLIFYFLVLPRIIL